MSEQGELRGPRTSLSGRAASEMCGGALADLGTDMPDRLYVIGDVSALAELSVAVIGARRATPYGLACARLAARTCAQMGMAVVSGAAVGCDQAAQREALERGARVVAVLGGGADVVYPRSSHAMLEKIVASGGAVISERPWGAPPERWAFVRRNRIIAALSRLLVVCEAGKRSGTFTTAEAAQGMGREILAFPGSFFSPNSWGSNRLVQEGAQCLCDEEDLQMAVSRACGVLGYSDAGQRRSPADVPGLSVCERKLMQAITASPIRPGEAARILGLDSVVTMRILGALEVRGLIERQVDGRYSPTQSALLRSREPLSQASPQGTVAQGQESVP